MNCSYNRRFESKLTLPPTGCANEGRHQKSNGLGQGAAMAMYKLQPSLFKQQSSVQQEVAQQRAPSIRGMI